MFYLTNVSEDIGDLIKNIDSEESKNKLESLKLTNKKWHSNNQIYNILKYDHSILLNELREKTGLIRSVIVNNEGEIVSFSPPKSILFSIFIALTFLAYLLPLGVYEIVLEPSVLQNNYNFYVFMLLVVGIFITILQTAYAMYLSLHKKLHILAYIYLIAFILNLFGNFYIKDFGILAASISTLIAYFIILSLQVLYVRKYLNAY